MNRRPPPGDHHDHHNHHWQPNRDPRQHPDHGPHRQPARPNAAPDSATVQGPVQIVRLGSGGDLITAAEYLLGYAPAEPSLITVGVTARRVAVIARTDLPDLATLPADLPAEEGLVGAWEMFTGPLANADAEAVAVIAYTGRPGTDGSPGRTG